MLACLARPLRGGYKPSKLVLPGAQLRRLTQDVATPEGSTTSQLPPQILQDIPEEQFSRPLPARQAILTVERTSEKDTVFHIAKQLRALRPGELYRRIWKGRGHDKRHAFVLLVTPKLAHILDSRETIHRFLKSLHGSGDHLEGLKLDVVCGVVDSMPPAHTDIPLAVGARSREGLSILYGESESLLPDLQKEREGTVEQQSKPGSIRLLGNKEAEYAVILPLANTLFTNGNLSTLSVSEYTASDPKDVRYTNTVPSQTIQHVSIAALDPVATPIYYFAQQPLTVRRRLVEGYGNIVRTLEFDRRNVLGASSELEVKVPKFLEKVTTDSTIEIWALLIPEHLAGQNMDIRLEHEYRNTLPYWLARGARLCKVQSGGGGWGAKAGLLSLDPETTYDTPSAELDELTFENLSTKGLGNVAASGQFIQFYTVRKHAVEGSTLLPLKAYPHLRRRSTVVGVLPSSVDMIQESHELDGVQQEVRTKEENDRQRQLVIDLSSEPFPELPSHPRRDNSTYVLPSAGSSEINVPMSSEVVEQHTVSEPQDTGSSMVLYKNSFGFLSEGGMYLEAIYSLKDGEKTKVSTKVSMPYSFMYQIHGWEPYEQLQIRTLAKSQTQRKAPTLPQGGRRTTKETSSDEATGVKIRRSPTGTILSTGQMILQYRSAIASYQGKIARTKHTHQNLLSKFPLAGHPVHKKVQTSNSKEVKIRTHVVEESASYNRDVARYVHAIAMHRVAIARKTEMHKDLLAKFPLQRVGGITGKEFRYVGILTSGSRVNKTQTGN